MEHLCGHVGHVVGRRDVVRHWKGHRIQYYGQKSLRPNAFIYPVLHADEPRRQSLIFVSLLRHCLVDCHVLDGHDRVWNTRVMCLTVMCTTAIVARCKGFQKLWRYGVQIAFPMIALVLDFGFPPCVTVFPILVTAVTTELETSTPARADLPVRGASSCMNHVLIMARKASLPRATIYRTFSVFVMSFRSFENVDVHGRV